MTIQPLKPLKPAAPDCAKCPADKAACCASFDSKNQAAGCPQDRGKASGFGPYRRSNLSLLSLFLLVSLALLVLSKVATLTGFVSDQMQVGLIAFSMIWAMGWVIVHDHIASRHQAKARQIDAERIEALAKAERSARISKEASDVAVAAKTNLVANMSHEIRTPMNGVIGFAQLLLSTKQSTEQRKYAELILESGESMVALLNDILDMAKIESGKMEVSPVRTNIRDLVTSATSMMKAAARQKSLSLGVQIDCAVPRELILDGLRVKQVLSNLIGNAIKFTDSGSVDVALKVIDAGSGKLIEFSVSDTGIGIAPEWQSVIFEQFVQADASSQRAHGGSGLGLPISRKLAQLMHGTLTLESHEGKGTHVALRLPLVKPAPKSLVKSSDESEEKEPAQTIERYAPRRGTVLVAEDSDVNRLLMQEMLSTLGFSTITASTGAEAIAKFHDCRVSGKKVDLILMDIQMPQVDGLEATRRLRGAGYEGDELPIIALTANAFQTDIEACFGVGMQEHLAKPVSQQDLIDALDRWMVHSH